MRFILIRTRRPVITLRATACGGCGKLARRHFARNAPTYCGGSQRRQHFRDMVHGGRLPVHYLLRFRSSETMAVVRRGEIDLWADRNDARRVHLVLAAVVMPLDVIDADGLRYSRHLIEITGVIPQIRVVGDPPQIAFEMTVVDSVKPHERGE